MAVGYPKRSVCEHKVASKGERCALMRISRNIPSGTVSVLLVKTRNIVERRAVQWGDGPDKTGSDSVVIEDFETKPGGHQSAVTRGSPQLNVQALELEKQSTLQELVQETLEALSKH